MTKTSFVLGASALAIILSAGTAAQAQSDVALTKARAFTDHSPAAENVEAALARRGIGADAIATLVPTKSYEGRFGRTHTAYEQRIDGKRVVGAFVKAAAGPDGRLISFSSRVSNGNSVRGQAVAPEAALAAALAEHFPGQAAPARAGEDGNVVTFVQDGFFHTAPTAEAVVVATRGGQMEPGWLVTVWSEDTNALYETLVDSKGRVVSSEDRTANDSYNIFPDHPGNSVQTVVSGPGAGNAESPAGWLGTSTQYATLISGNNVRAYLDRDNNNAPDSASSVISDGVFDTLGLLNQDPTTASNQEVAIQNLFYFNNVIHDELYRHGFTEATGNFQENNFGKGGAGSDSVDAEGQDGGGTNNANFATPSDGSNPRMQMYLWTQTSPYRDGDLDSDIMWHEYGHGLTWRMIGSMSGSISGAIGEGMSDVLAIIMNDDDTVGEYSYNSSNGIRRYPYEGYPLTLGDFSGSSVHSDGEIYAATLWDLKKRYYAAGFVRDDILGDVVDGMNFTPSGPTYQDMRDGIIAAAPSGRQCLVWESFAKFGIGENSSMATSFPFGVNVTEDFTVPSSCTGGTSNEAPVASFTYSCTELSCSFTDGSTDDSGVTGYSWSFGDGASSTSQNPTHSFSADGTYTVTLTVTDAEGLSDSSSQSVTVATGGDTGGAITLSASGYKNKGRHTIDLTWSGANTAVDIFRNGSRIANGTANDGFYTDATNNKGGGTSYTYEVCETGTSTCSSSVTVSF